MGIKVIMNGHHLILGEMTDFLTHQTVIDTHDERYRQKVARFLVEKSGYFKSDIQSRCDLQLSAGGKCAIVTVDFIVRLQDRDGMMIKYGPGSLVTRRRSVLAASRLWAPYQIPIAVVTNGENAEIIDGKDGRVVGTGYKSIPTRQELLQILTDHCFEAISKERIEMESRIMFACEVDDSCPCDDSVCRL